MYLSIKEVMSQYSIGRTTVYRLLNKGHLKAVKVGSLTRIDKQSVDQYFQSLPTAHIEGRY